MGNSIKDKISNDIYQMKNLKGSFNYEKSKEIYLKIKGELIKIKNQDHILEISNYLLYFHTDQKVAFEF